MCRFHVYSSLMSTSFWSCFRKPYYTGLCQLQKLGKGVAGWPSQLSLRLQFRSGFQGYGIESHTRLPAQQGSLLLLLSLPLTPLSCTLSPYLAHSHTDSLKLKNGVLKKNRKRNSPNIYPGFLLVGLTNCKTSSSKMERE